MIEYYDIKVRILIVIWNKHFFEAKKKGGFNFKKIPNGANLFSSDEPVKGYGFSALGIRKSMPKAIWRPPLQELAHNANFERSCRE